MEKVCNTCNINKSLSEFSKDKYTKDGLQYRCKECTNQHYQDNKESRLKYQNQYDQDNKEAIDEYQRQLNISEGYGVYTLTHLPTQCYYIGEGQLYSRRIKHFSLLKRGKNKYGLLQEHYDKHPNKDDWEFEVVMKWDNQNKVEGEKLEDKLIREGFSNNSVKILNKKVGIDK